MWMKQIPFPERSCGIIAVCVFDAWNTDRPALSAWSVCVCGGGVRGALISVEGRGCGRGWGGGGCPLSVDVVIRGNSCHAEIYQRGWKADSPRRKGVTPSSPIPHPPPPPGPPPLPACAGTVAQEICSWFGMACWWWCHQESKSPIGCVGEHGQGGNGEGWGVSGDWPFFFRLCLFSPVCVCLCYWLQSNPDGRHPYFKSTFYPLRHCLPVQVSQKVEHCSLKPPPPPLPLKEVNIYFLFILI